VTGPGPDALVIGSGVAGLTTAIRLCEAGARTHILTSCEPAATTSALATAMVGPTFGLSGPRNQAWEAATVEAMRAEDLSTGVHVCRGRFLAVPAGFIPPGAEALPGFGICEGEDLPVGYETGFWAEVPLVDMPRYLERLVDRFEGLGGTIEVTALDSIADATAIAPRVANCSGLGSRELVPDPDVGPSRGPKIVVENPGLDTFAIVGPPGPVGTSFHPHGDLVVLGGSATPSDDTEPDLDEERAIIERCAAIEPRLRDARVVEHRVGLRPDRAEVRLEREDHGEARVVHNYGHGGLGVTLSWGCADDVVSLLLD
jgi:D-amino-acid oxidase